MDHIQCPDCGEINRVAKSTQFIWFAGIFVLLFIAAIINSMENLSFLQKILWNMVIILPLYYGGYYSFLRLEREEEHHG
ncbi:hypothetical protein GCM10010954_11900 [Halobacillus andaensis]|uniref:Uncharacterized protein n=2 Tax=Halobacillus andaensis TaxID=1176239 RepID=A0A917B282_HALAA|nr:hypothetical protein [Halobacillus andaensis]GGF14932.1 hypothetical protein GCM10010954_11900 [Halobacillus andaensis]